MIRFSRHLLERMRQRCMDEKMIKEIFDRPGERYLDIETGYGIALKRVPYLDQPRELIVVYRERGEDIQLITAHVLKKGQKDRRIKSGRWQKA